MTSTPPSRPDTPLAGWRAAGVRSGLAPAPLSRASLGGVAAVLALGVLEVLAGEEVLVATLLVLPPLAVALTGRWGDTLLVAAFAVLVALTAPLLGDTIQQAIAPVLVLAGGTLAVALALARAGSAVTIERFRLLVGVADAADHAEGHDALVEEVLDLLVPALGDVATVDVLRGGARRRIGSRTGPGVDPAVAAAMTRRRPLEGDPRSSEAAIAADQARLVEPDDALMEAAASSPGDAELLRGLHVTTAIVVPLRARGRVIGAISGAYGPSGRRHTESDLRFAEVLAGRVALALDNAGLTSELSEAEEQFGAVVHALAEAVTMNDADGRTVYANRAAAELLGVEGPDALLGAAPGEVMERFAVFDAHGRPLSLQDLPSTRMLAGEPDPAPLLVRNVVRATGEERWLLHRCSALRDSDGALVRVVNVIENLTEVKRAEWTQRLLAEASEALSSSMDSVEQLDALVGVLVPALAQRAVVELPDERGEPKRVAEAGEAAAEPGGELRVPLPAGAEALGTLTLERGPPWRGFAATERELAAEIGRRTGVAVLNARSHSRRTAIARALQHGLLPPELPDVPGWTAAVLYRPAGEFNEVGGDFYDVFAGPHGWMVVIGDVAGQGAEAAAQTSLARFTLRTAAELTGDVSAAVARLNDTLRGQAGLPLCTVVCAELRERDDGTAVVTLASAGHPPPLRVRGREVVPVGKAGTIAGAFEDLQWPATPVELEPGDLLVLYTDGVLDAMGEDERYGEQRLRDALGRLDGAVGERLDALRGELEAFERGPQRDDTTVLVLQYRGEGDQPAEASRRAASSITSGRLQKAKRTRFRPASGSS
jgi:PAS domain S-box-containing protein